MAIEDSDLIRLDERYVTRNECNATVNAIKDEIQKDRQDVVVMKSDLSSIKKVLWFIAAGVGTLIIGGLWKVIAK